MLPRDIRVGCQVVDETDVEVEHNEARIKFSEKHACTYDFELNVTDMGKLRRYFGRFDLVPGVI